MKYCIEYYKKFRYLDIVDEIIFDISKYKDEIVNEIQKNEWKNEQCIIIDMIEGTEYDIPIVRMCKKIHNNLKVKISIGQGKELIDKLQEEELKFFFAECATTPDAVYGMIMRGASDVYIAESLAFNIENIGNYCKSKNVNVRIIPNIAQYETGFGTEIPDPYKFFVRPEDTELYTPYADIFELIGPEDRLSVLYEIYKNRYWAGDLQELIVGFKEKFPNRGIIENFGPARLKCNQRCMQEKCSLCKQAKELSQRFVDNRLEVRQPIHKEWKNETRSHKEAMQFIEKSTSSVDDKISEE